MNLRDYIGDTRTDSLPPGFLKSIKIKYKHEASNVFSGLLDVNDVSAKEQKQNKEKDRSLQLENNICSEGEETENGQQSFPSFMKWRVPSRLINQSTKQCKEQATAAVERTSLKTRSVSNTSKQRPGKLQQSFTEILKKEHFVEDKASECQFENISNKEPKDFAANEKTNIAVTSKTEMKSISPTKRKKNYEKKQREGFVVGYNKLSPKPEKSSNDLENRRYNSFLPILEGSKMPEKLCHTPERMEKILEWMKISTDREKIAALQLFSKYNKSKNSDVERTKTRDRVLITIKALEKQTKGENVKKSRGCARLGGNPVFNMQRQEKDHLKTWHHIPLYQHANINNQSAVFQQPSKVYETHFTIHPEWGVHKLNKPIPNSSF